MSAITDRFARARQLSRLFFPAWSRRMRARWVLAKLNAPREPRVGISAACTDLSGYRFARRLT